MFSKWGVECVRGMKLTITSICTTFAVVLGLVVLQTSQVAAVTVGFERITSNSAADAASQLSVDVSDNAGGTGALFSFIVSAGPNPGANIAEIYFDDKTPLFTPPPLIHTQVGAVFENPAGNNSPPTLPSGNNANPAFVSTAMLEAEASGNSATGVSIGDTLILELIYAAGFNFASLLTALDNGDLRIGLHVRSLLAGESDTFVSTPPSPVPLPAALPLFGGALGLIGLLGWRRKRAAAA